MSLDQLAASALRLPPNERACLAESLWESLTDPFEIIPADESANVRLAVERDRQLESGEVKALTHRELMSRLGA